MTPRAVRAINRVRDELAGLIAIQIVFLPASTVADDVVHAALDAGPTWSGAPHLADDPLTDLPGCSTSPKPAVSGLTYGQVPAGRPPDSDPTPMPTGWRRGPADRIRTASRCSRLSTLSPGWPT